MARFANFTEFADFRPLADADCALSGLRVVLEMLLAAERTRQNGEPERYVGDRVMKGLVIVCQSLCVQAAGGAAGGGA